LFVEAFLGPAEGNATKAALAAGYSLAGARQAGHKLLQKPQVVAKLGDTRDKLGTAVAVADAALITHGVLTGDQALERLSLIAQADITELLPKQHRLRKLPRQLRLLIKSVRPTAHGEVLEVHDAMRATELLARAGGKLKETIQVESLEDVLARSWKYHRPESVAS
jgi:phage terminase small subunit